MHFLDLPDEVLIGKQGPLKYLDWNDLLRFRRACKDTKRITHAYLQVNADRAPEIEIDDGKDSKTFAAFNEMGIRTEKLFLNNTFGYLFYQLEEESTVRQFLEDFGPFVKHLRVKNLSLFPTGRELDFIQSLPNIKSFEAEKFVFGPDHDTPSRAQALAKRVMVPKDWHLFATAFPPIFKNLESIRIGQDPEDDTMNKIKVTAEIFILCQKLKMASLPFTWTPVLPQPYGDNRGILMGEFNFLDLYTEPRPSDVYKELGILEEYDFVNYHDNYGGWDEWRNRTGIPMSLLLEQEDTVVPRTEDIVQSCPNLKRIKLVRWPGRNKQLLKLWEGLVGLEEVTLEKCRDVGTVTFVGEDGRDPIFFKLKNLKKLTLKGLDEMPKITDLLFSLVLSKMKIKALVLTFDRPLEKITKEGINAELELKFVEGGKWREEDMVVPRTEDIVQSCPNLKRIKLVRWPGKNKQLLKLWMGLVGLEVTLEKCTDVGTVTFVGEDGRDPIFFKLKNLKKLTLKGLDEMPKITDLLFSLVLSKMKIKTLVLTADKPFEKITKEGINALLEGPFNEAIEKFPFKDWLMAGVSTEEFEELFGKGLLQFLDWNDLLRLRRVSKWSLEFTNVYLRDNPERAPEREIIEEKDKSLEAFLDLGIPTTKLFLNNPSGKLFYELENCEKLREFMEGHGCLIKELRVIQLTLCPSGKELEFLESLVNLKTFECGYLTIGEKMEEYREQAFATGEQIGQDETLMKCLASKDKVIKLYNVNTLWLSGRWFDNYDTPDHASPMLGIAIASMTNLDNCVNNLDFRNLEKLVIPFTSRCISGARRPDWPALKSMDITVDSQIGKCWDVTGHAKFEGIRELTPQPTMDLFKFLWGGYKIQEKMTELNLEFVQGNYESRMGLAKEVGLEWKKSSRKLLARVADDVAVPKTEMIATRCPNLKIKLVKWPGKNKQLIKCWESLEYCEKVNEGEGSDTGDEPNNEEVKPLENDGNNSNTPSKSNSRKRPSDTPNPSKDQKISKGNTSIEKIEPLKVTLV